MSGHPQNPPDGEPGDPTPQPTPPPAPPPTQPEASLDDDIEEIFETVLPLRADQMTTSQMRLLERLVEQGARHSPSLRCRKRLLNGVGILAAAVLAVAFILLHGNAGRGWACATACIAVPATVGLVSILFERFLYRPLRWSLQPWSCPSCGYDLEGLVERAQFNCPECGAACDVESRRHLAMDTATLLAEVLKTGGNLAWAVKRNPGLRSLGARECAEILERAESATRRPLRSRLGTVAAVALGLLLLTAGLLVAGLGIVRSSWLGALGTLPVLGALGTLPVLLGALLLLRTSKPRRQRMAQVIEDALHACAGSGQARP